jgi:hypothetical protein
MNYSSPLMCATCPNHLTHLKIKYIRIHVVYVPPMLAASAPIFNCSAGGIVPRQAVIQLHARRTVFVTTGFLFHYNGEGRAAGLAIRGTA